MKTLEEFIDYVQKKYDAIVDSDDAISKFYYILFLDHLNLTNIKRAKHILANYLVGFQKYIDDVLVSGKSKEYYKKSFVVISDLWNYLMDEK